MTSVTNADTCAGNLPGDLTCTNTVTVNPLPTASLVTSQTVCNGSQPVLQANLTGLGPWTVIWSDGFVQTTNAPVGSGVLHGARRVFSGSDERCSRTIRRTMSSRLRL